MIKKIVLIFSLFVIILGWLLEVSSFSQTDIIPTDKTIIDVNSIDVNSPLNWIFSSVKDTIFWILAVVAIWVFLFIWSRLVVAKWNPEEFKKASMQLIYAVIWLVVVTLAYAAVKLVSWLSL